MKYAFLLLTLITSTAIGQCYDIPTGGPGYFSGSATFPKNSDFGNWTTLTFNGQFVVQADLVAPEGVGRIYCAGAVSMNYVTLNGNDTIFCKSLTSIASISQSTGTGNVIYLGPNIPYLLIGNRLYWAGTDDKPVYAFGVKIIKCKSNAGALPLHSTKFSVKKIGDDTYLADFEIAETGGSKSKSFTIRMLGDKGEMKK